MDHIKIFATGGVFSKYSSLDDSLYPAEEIAVNARVVRRKMSNDNLKRATHRTCPTPTPPSGNVIRILSPP